MPFGSQPLEFYDRDDDEDEFYRDHPFLIGDCLIQPTTRERFVVRDKQGKHLGTFFDVNDAYVLSDYEKTKTIISKKKGDCKMFRYVCLMLCLIVTVMGCDHFSNFVINQPGNPLVGTWETHTINGLTTDQAVVEFGGSFGATDLNAIWQFNPDLTWEAAVAVGFLGGKLNFKHAGDYSFTGTGITLVAESTGENVFLSDVFRTLAGTWNRQADLLTLSLTDQYGRQFVFELHRV